MGKLFQKKTKEEAAEPEKRTWQQNLMLDLHDLLYVLAIFMVIYMLFFRVVVVVGSSMYDTLLDGDRLVLVSNAIYREPKQGDIIVASKESFHNGECIVKRVIATEGQRVDIKNGLVYVDGVALEEDYTYTSTEINIGSLQFPLTVDEGKVFVLGDNRNESADSRSKMVGLIDEREIMGKAIFLMTPGTHKGTQEADFGRIGVID